MTSHDTTSEDLANHSRFRGAEYPNHDIFFFQWWNYLIHDSETGHHFNLIYQVTRFENTSGLQDKVGVTLALYKHATEVNTASVDFPLSALQVSNYADLNVRTLMLVYHHRFMSFLSLHIYCLVLMR